MNARRLREHRKLALLLSVLLKGESIASPDSTSRSGILHGSNLIAFDEGRALGWDPPWAKQNDLHRELWGITQLALRNYLRNPVATTCSAQSVEGGRKSLRRELALVGAVLVGAILGAGACAFLH